MTYFAIIGDIINSRELSSRKQVQDKLEATLNKLNQKYPQVIVSKFTITLGDEFQGLLTMDAPIFQMIDEIRKAMAPVDIRFGIGLGEMKTDINALESIGADGPAYWYARAAIDYVHQKDDYGYTQLAVGLADERTAQQINALLAVTEFMRKTWTASQFDTFNALLSLNIYNEKFKQRDVAKELNMTDNDLSKRLKSSGIKVYFRSKQAILELLRATEGGK